MNNLVARIIKQPRRYWAKFLLHFPYLSDKSYLKALYLYRFGKPLDLDNPKTFNEKLQWLKLYNRKPEYTTLVDKYEVKKYVSDTIGAEFTIPTLGVWTQPSEIDWDLLPNQFVLKATHGGGGNGVIICKDKRTIDKVKIERRLSESLDADLYKQFREWPYKDVPRKIIAEQYMEDSTSPDSDLTDYKFYCFNGEPKYCQIIRDRNTKETIDFYDLDWNHQEFVGLNPKCKNGETPVEKPDCLQDMVSICKKISKGIPFIRVDLYNIYGHIYFGELTFFPASGMGTFSPSEWDNKLGEMIIL